MASSSSKNQPRRAAQDSWTKEENKLFELALAYYDEGVPDRWQKVARAVGSKTAEQVQRHHELLVKDLVLIDSAKEPIANYPSSSNGIDAAWGRKIYPLVPSSTKAFQFLDLMSDLELSGSQSVMVQVDNTTFKCKLLQHQM